MKCKSPVDDNGLEWSSSYLLVLGKQSRHFTYLALSLIISHGIPLWELKQWNTSGRSHRIPNCSMQRSLSFFAPNDPLKRNELNGDVLAGCPCLKCMTHVFVVNTDHREWRNCFGHRRPLTHALLLDSPRINQISRRDSKLVTDMNWLTILWLDKLLIHPSHSFHQLHLDRRFSATSARWK